ncbi:hypothetical protein DFP93_102139 [Aneurinibacillus soli]|uniref:Uncharacterized protein n=1 Tax=Aneurinibacillus soli TaxID=1500254 RepID=A0A0U5BA65_9BACL|nr:hypothetical protein [Aneurinibacillus soli]PYE63455.1 hypothetical protein DFP93_102139 [Aneurinibacillus soli]BAU27613.1 hypothetical protein CB4_01787 [Aneurinibacillus soli]
MDQISIFDFVEVTQVTKPSAHGCKAHVYGPIPFWELKSPVECRSRSASHEGKYNHMVRTWGKAVHLYFKYPVSWFEAIKLFEKERAKQLEQKGSGEGNG